METGELTPRLSRATHARKTRKINISICDAQKESYKEQKTQFPFSDKLRTDLFIYLDRRWVEGGYWSKLPPAGASFSLTAAGEIRKGDRHCWPSLERIAMRSGIKSTDTVKKAITDYKHWVQYAQLMMNNETDDSKLFSVTRNKKRRIYHFYNLPRPTIREYDHDIHIAFFKYIVDSGYFQRVSSRAHKLLVTIKCKARANLKIMDELGDLEKFPRDLYYYQNNYDEFIKEPERDYDICRDKMYELRDLSGLNNNTFFKAKKELEENGFIKQVKTSLGDVLIVYKRTADDQMISRDVLKTEIRGKHKWIKNAAFS